MICKNNQSLRKLIISIKNKKDIKNSELAILTNLSLSTIRNIKINTSYELNFYILDILKYDIFLNMNNKKYNIKKSKKIVILLIKKCRKFLKLTKKEFAFFLEITRPTMYKIYKNDENITFKTLFLILKNLDIEFYFSIE